MTSAPQYVTLVVQGGTPVRLANQKGAPYPTTGRGGLVFSDDAVLNNPTFTGRVINVSGDTIGVAAGLATAPSIFFGPTLNNDGFFSRGQGHVNTTINGVEVVDVSSTGIRVAGNIVFDGTITGPDGPITGGGGGGGGGLNDLNTASGTTVDTGETYRIIMLSTGTVRAVPYAVVAPPPPTTVTITTRLTSINIVWPIVPAARSYVIHRNGVQYATTEFQSFRDTEVVLDNTYTYTVSSVDVYLQRSVKSMTVTGTPTASLNSAPQGVSVTCWPLPIPTDGWSYVRVNAREIDVQNLSFTLGVDAGSLTATADPSVWIIRV